MSQENVEVVRALFDAWNAGDMSRIYDLHDPEVIGRPFKDWPEPGPFVGREAVMWQWKEMRETWDADSVEPIGNFIDAADRVVVRYVWHGVGHGPESNLEVTGIFTVRKGAILAMEFFRDHGEALEAAGLSEQDAHADS
jgi:ketosteroid isomerase-like protein